MMRTIFERLLALAVIAAYPLVAFYPFDFRLPERVVNAAGRAADGSVRFAGEGILRSKAAPAWLRPAIAEGRFAVILDVEPARRAPDGLAPILAVSKNSRLANLTVGQERHDLVVRLRTTEAGRDGRREIRVPDAFARGERTHVNLRLFPAGGRTRLELRVNGLKKAARSLPLNVLAGWNPRYRLALGNEMTGNRPWLGTVHRANARAGRLVVEYTAAGALERPVRYWKVPNDPDLAPFDPAEWRDVLRNLVGFVPLGMVIALAMWRRHGRVGWLPALISLAVSFALETAQFLIPGRTPALADLIFDTLGGLLGGALVALALTRRTQTFRRLESDPI